MPNPIPPGTIHIPQPFPNNPLVGTSPGTTRGSTGVLGQSNFGVGVWGQSIGEPWVEGSPPAADGVLGEGATGVHGLGAANGVIGETKSPNDSGVWGNNTGAGYGVSGSTNSQFQPGAGGTAGVWGNNAGSGTGVKGTSVGGDGVLGLSGAKDHAGVSAVNAGGGMGLWAGGTPAGHFEGDVEVTGDIRLLNQDCAEDFEISGEEQIEPGTVMVIDQEGALRRSKQAYDRRVAGVVSGAGDCRPGIIFGRQQLQGNRMPVALVGKVHCKVDASYSPIEVGDLLTTSPTPGYAMKGADPLRAFGSVIGKALRRLEAGQGLIPILVALQ